MVSQSLKKQNCIWKKDVLLAPFSTYKIGGPAKFFIQVSSINDSISAMKFCHENHLNFFVLGKGSNILFDDRGFDGAIIYNTMRGFEAIDEVFDVASGTSFSRLGAQAAKLGHGGLEYAIGIPGTIGGAIFMNAGASGQEISPLVESVEYLHENGERQTFHKEELTFRYRWSTFHELKGIILSVKLKLYPYSKARERQLEIIDIRKKSQPYNEPSCGCVFRNGEEYSTGKLLEELGLKGFSIGGAQISTLHANFIVNTGNAKASDVKDLVLKIEKDVLEKKGIHLKREIRFVPFQRRNDAL